MIRISALSRHFDRFPALDDVSLSIAPGTLVALLGPSGSGKTTLLRLLAGLDFPDSGAIWIDGADATNVPANRRGIGLVFQHYALFRHMTVAENIAFGLKARPRRHRPSKAEIVRRVEALLDLVQLPGLGRRYPDQLSGGQRQRVALARALAIEPRLLLLDEPFGALDAKVRKELRRSLRRLHDATGLTTVFVTHDQEEALDLADVVVVLNQGRIEQVGSPADMVAAPASAFVARFIGEATELECVVRDGWAEAGPLRLAVACADGPATLFLRPHDIGLAPDGRGVPAILRHSVPRGAVLRLQLEVAGMALEVEVPRADGQDLTIGHPLTITVDKGLAFPRSPAD